MIELSVLLDSYRFDENMWRTETLCMFVLREWVPVYQVKYLGDGNC